MTVKKGVVGAILLGIVVLAFLVLRAVAIPIIFGLLFAYIFTPIYRKINNKIKHPNISALAIIFLIILIIAIPLIYLVPQLIKEAVETYSVIQKVDFKSSVEKVFSEDAASALAVHFNNLLTRFFASLVSQLTNIITNLPSMSLKIVVFLFTFYFAIRDNQELKNYLSKISPFSKSTGDKFMKEFRNITNAVIFGQVLIGIVTAIAFGAGMYVLGVPRVLILSFVTALVAVIPVLGAWMVWFPLGIAMIALGRTTTGILVLLYGGLFVSMIDNILRPYFISKKSSLPIVVSVIGTIGGLFFLGILGLILGPLILAYLMIIIDFYQQGKLNELFEKNETES